MASEPEFSRDPKSTAVRVGPSTAVTATNSTDVINLTAHGFANGDEVRFISGTMPTGPGFTVNTGYFVVNQTPNTFQLAAALGGSAILFTTDGANLVIRRNNALLDGTQYRETLFTVPSGNGARGGGIYLISVTSLDAAPIAGSFRVFLTPPGGAARLLRRRSIAATDLTFDIAFDGGLQLEPGTVISVNADTPGVNTPNSWDVVLVNGGLL
jgi:hypothetical protein